MGLVNADEIIGYQVNGEYYCRECAQLSLYFERIKEDEIVTEQDRPERAYIFCDSQDCGEQL